MKALFDALYARFETTTLHDKLTELYNTEADAEAVFPYGVFSIVSATTEAAEFTHDWENCLIQFNLFDDDDLCTDINAVYAALKNAFHKFDLVIVDAETVSLKKEVANLIRIEKVWQYNVSFRILIRE